MPLLNTLSDPESWKRFYEYKTSLASPGVFTKTLKRFISEQAYLPVCGSILRGEPFPLPRKAVISKMSTGKKRTVYIYPQAHGLVLKHLTWLMLRRYDALFCPNLYSFRPGKTAKDALRRLIRTPSLPSLWTYKADIHNYFNSIPVERLLPMLKEALSDDPPLCDFLSRLLSEPHVLDKGSMIPEEKGIMAGTPLSAFFANLYLKELDRHFYEAGVTYARYSDDIILFADSEEALIRHRAFVHQFLQEAGLLINPDKEKTYAPGEGWTFLGFCYKDGIVDIAPASLRKLKAKMRRKTRALARWKKRRGLEGNKAAAAFIRVFNRKLFEPADGRELSWSLWFFSVINTARSLRGIDRYAQECLRYLISGRRTKARFNVRYEDLKALGYRSLVHEYYRKDRLRRPYA